MRRRETSGQRTAGDRGGPHGKGPLPFLEERDVEVACVRAQLFDGARPERVARGNKNFLLALLHGMAWHRMGSHGGAGEPVTPHSDGLNMPMQCGTDDARCAVLRCAAHKLNVICMRCAQMHGATGRDLFEPERHLSQIG